MAAKLREVETNYEALNPKDFGWIRLKGSQEAANLLRDRTSLGRIMVSKIFPDHLRDIGADWEGLRAKLPDAAWIHLYRRNVTEQFESRERAKATGQWTVWADDELVPAPELELVHADLAAFYEQVVADDRLAFEALRDSPRYRRIAYEDFVRDPDAWFRDVFCPLVGRVVEKPIERPFVKQRNEENRRDGQVALPVLLNPCGEWID